MIAWIDLNRDCCQGRVIRAVVGSIGETIQTAVTDVRSITKTAIGIKDQLTMSRCTDWYDR